MCEKTSLLLQVRNRWKAVVEGFAMLEYLEYTVTKYPCPMRRTLQFLSDSTSCTSMRENGRRLLSLDKILRSTVLSLEDLDALLQLWGATCCDALCYPRKPLRRLQYRSQSP